MFHPGGMMSLPVQSHVLPGGMMSLPVWSHVLSRGGLVIGGLVPEGVWYYHPCEQTDPCENTVISKIFMISDRLFGVEL